MTQVLSTDQRQQGFKRLLKILSNKNLKRQEAVRKLIEPVKVRKLDGREFSKDPIYSDSGSATDLVKNIVSDESFPVKSEGEYLVRTDLEKKPV